MAEKDPSEKALEDLLADLSAPPKEAKEEAKTEDKKPASAATSRDAVGERASELDEMAAGLEELLSSASLTEHVESAKAEEEARVAEEKIEMEDMESALASALAVPVDTAATTFDEIEESWEEPETPMAVLPGEPAPAATVDAAALYQAPVQAGVEEVVVVEPEKLSEKRKRFYTKTGLGVLAAAIVAYLFFTFLISPSLRYYYYTQLVKAVTEKRYTEADQLLLTSEGFGMTKEKYMNLSDIALAHRDLPRSLGFSRKAFDLDPAYTPALNRVARIYLMQGRIEEAQTQAEQTRKVNPDNLETLTILATAYYKKQEIPKAQHHLADVLARDRNYVPALELLRDIYIDLKNYNQALSLQKQLTEIKRDIPEAQKFLDEGKIYYSAGKFATAVVKLNDAYVKDPTLWEAGYFLAKSYAGTGQFRLASEQISRTLKEAPSPTLDMYYLRALSNYNLGNIRPTIEELQRIRVINPKYAPLYVLMGKIYVYTYGEYGAGLKFLERARDLKYEDNDFYKTLGEAYFNLKRYREALNAWSPLLVNISSTDPFLFRISACLIHLNQMDMAQAILTKMWSTGSRSTAIYNNLGVIHELLGKRDTALRFYFLATEKAVTTGRKDSTVPKKNFDRLISGQGSMDIDESLLNQS